MKPDNFSIDLSFSNVRFLIGTLIEKIKTAVSMQLNFETNQGYWQFLDLSYSQESDPGVKVSNFSAESSSRDVHFSIENLAELIKRVVPEEGWF